MLGSTRALGSGPLRFLVTQETVTDRGDDPDSDFTSRAPCSDGSRRWALRLVPDAQEAACHVSLTLVAQLPAAYPMVTPLLELEAVTGLSPALQAELLALLASGAQANLGTAMIFTITDEAKDWLVANNTPPAPPHPATGAPLQRQTSAELKQFRGRQRAKQRERTRLRKVKRPGTIGVGDDVDVHHHMCDFKTRPS